MLKPRAGRARKKTSRAKKGQTMEIEEQADMTPDLDPTEAEAPTPPEGASAPLEEQPAAPEDPSITTPDADAAPVAPISELPDNESIPFARKGQAPGVGERVYFVNGNGDHVPAVILAVVSSFPDTLPHLRLQIPTNDGSGATEVIHAAYFEDAEARRIWTWHY